MRIDVFFDVYPHPSKPYFEAQLSEWRRAGHVLRIYSLGQIPGGTSEFPISFVKTLRQAPLRLISTVLWRLARNPVRSWRVIRSERQPLAIVKRLATDAQLPTDPPDVYFMHNLATAVHFSYLRCAAPRTTLAIYYHGGVIPGVRQIPPAQSARALGRAHIVFSNTQASVNEVIARGAVPERTARIPVGFPLERFTPPPNRTYLPNNCWRFACLGRMAREKGFDVVLQAFAELRKQREDFHLTLIGGGPELTALKTLAVQLALREHVTFAGFIDSYQDMVDHLGTIDVLIFSSLPVPGSNFKDTQACVMQEAMLMGAGVIASDIGGIRESLPTIFHPYLYTPGSQDELLARLASIMTHDAATLRTLSGMARHFVVDHYDIRSINEQLLARVAAVKA